VEMNNIKFANILVVTRCKRHCLTIRLTEFRIPLLSTSENKSRVLRL